MKNLFLNWVDLSAKESKLLLQLSLYTKPFTIEEVYTKEKSIEQNEVEFYQLFFALEFDGYLHAVKPKATKFGITPLLSEITFLLTGNGQAAAKHIC